jgi:hypothetical protein
MFDPTIEDNSLLMMVREGMRVLDSSGAAIGKVRSVQMGGNDPEDAERQAREAGPIDRDDTFSAASTLSDLPDTLFRFNDGLAGEVRLDLQRKGFIQIDSAGFFAADRYAAADQIASVEGDDVVLSVPGDALPKG